MGRLDEGWAKRRGEAVAEEPNTDRLVVVLVASAELNGCGIAFPTLRHGLISLVRFTNLEIFVSLSRCTPPGT